MKTFTIYHNPRCSKSRQALQILRDKGIEPNIIEYLKTPLQKDELKNISNILGLRPKDFVRKNEKDFKENNLGKYIDNDEKIRTVLLDKAFTSLDTINDLKKIREIMKDDSYFPIYKST